MRNDILFGILITLLRKGKCTYNQLAEKFEVSKRTIQRYCLNLEMSGIPTVCSYGRTGGIEIMGSFNLNNMFFTKAELNRLLSHLHASPLTSLDTIDHQIEEKLKLHTQKAKEQTSSDIIIDYNSWNNENKINPIIKLLNQNLNKKITYELTYVNSTGITSTRIISPYKLILKDSMWYLFAYCHKRKAPRVFKINRIQELTPSTTQFVEINLTEEDIKSHLQNFFEEIKLKLQVKEHTLTDTLEWIKDPQITHTENDSALVIGTATKNSELISKIISNPNQIKLLEPASLISEIKETITQLQTIYN